MILDHVPSHHALGPDDVIVEFGRWKNMRGRKRRIYCDKFTSGSHERDYRHETCVGLAITRHGLFISAGRSHGPASPNFTECR